MKLRERDTRVEIHKPAPGVDDNGQPLTSLVLVATRRAKVEPVSAREYFEADTERGEVSYRVTFLRDSVTAAITHGYTLKFDSVTLDIDSPIKPKGRRSVEVVGRG